MNIPQYLYSTIEELQRYMALLVQALQTNLSNNGFILPPLTAAQVTMVTSSTFLPVMPPSTQWFNSTIGKMQFITVQAIPSGLPGGPANATIETITSA